MAISQEFQRSNYEDKFKMDQIKKKLYTDSTGNTIETVKDPYTGKDLYLKKADAKQAYGDDQFTQGAAQLDHIVSLSEIHGQHKNSAWLDDGDIKTIANSKSNFVNISQNTNQSKGDKNHLSIIKQDKEFTKGGKARVVEDRVKAKIMVETKIQAHKIQNISSAGLEGAGEAIEGASVKLIYSSGKKTIEVIRGDMEIDDAADEIIKEVGAVAAFGAITKISTIQANQIIHNTGIKRAMNIPEIELGTIAGYAYTFSTNIVPFINGDISGVETIIRMTEETIGDILSKSVGVLGYCIGGQAGALVAYYTVSNAYNAIVSAARACRESKEMLHQIQMYADEMKERMQLLQNCVKDMMQELDQMNVYTDQIFSELVNCVQEEQNEKITECFCNLANAYNIKLTFTSFEQFDEFMNDDDTVFTL